MDGKKVTFERIERAEIERENNQSRVLLRISGCTKLLFLDVPVFSIKSYFAGKLSIFAYIGGRGGC